MATHIATSQTFKSIALAALIVLVLIILAENLEGLSALWATLLCATTRQALALLPSIIPAAWQVIQATVLDHRHASPCPFQMLLSFSSLLRILAAAA